MKLLIALVGIFSILTNFSTLSLLNIKDNTLCESLSKCDNVDFHSESSQDHESENHKHHCHGHNVQFSNASITNTKKLLRLIPYDSYVNFIQFKIGKLQNYQSEINRPPIF